MGKKSKYERKQFLVDRKIQYRFTRFVMIFVTATAFITSAIVFFVILTLLGDKLAAVYPQGRLMPIIRATYISFFMILIASVPIIYFFSIRFSHLFVGPLGKIYRYLDSIGDGLYIGKLIIRKKDELQDLVNIINNMATNLKSKGAIKEQSPNKQSH